MNGVVAVPKVQPVHFPDRCTVCGIEQPGHHVAVTSLAVDSTAPLLRSFGPLFWVKMPFCAVCGSRMRRQVWLRWITFWIGLGVSVAVVVNVYGWYRGHGDRALWQLAVIALWLPWLIWQMWFPLPVSFSIDDDEILYRFKSAEFGQEFEALNLHRGDCEMGAGDREEPPSIVV